MMGKLPQEVSNRSRASTDETDASKAASALSAGVTGLLVNCAAGCWAFPLASSRSYLLGRGPECDVVVDDSSVSRQHARLTTGDDFFLEDLNSTNGTRAQGKKLSEGKRVRLGLGEAFEVGSATMLLHRAVPASARARPSAADSSETVIRDPVMKRLYGMLDIIAPTSLSVLILGETGVGKEVFAEALHRLSSRAAKPFLKLNCAALPESILESELFGYEKGAFTGATQTKVGLFEVADGGTLFLDEVGDMAHSTQTKVLRALESGEVMRLGGTSTRKVDVRLVSAANRDLRKLLASNLFRADLFFRLNGITMTLPPLRKRVDDVLPLAMHFMERMSRKLGRPTPRIGEAATAAIGAHAWPGNVRELRNVIERAVVLCQTNELRPGDLLLDEEPDFSKVETEAPSDQTPSQESPANLPTMQMPAPPKRSAALELRVKMEDFERVQIVDALATTRGNQTRAAKLLGIARRTLIKKIVRHGIERPRADSPRTAPEDDRVH